MNLELTRRQVLGVLAFFAVALALLGAMLARLGVRPLAATPARTVSVLVNDAQGITPQSDVLVRGVAVGTVIGVQAESHGTLLTLGLNGGGPPLRAGASVRIGDKTPLGEPFVDLTPGSAGPRLAPGVRLRDEPSVQIDDALAVFNHAGRGDLRSTLLALGTGARDPATRQTVSQALAALQRATGATGHLLAELAAQRTQLTGLVTDGGSVLDALAARAGTVTGLTRDTATTLQAVAGEHAALAAVIARLPGLLRSARGTLNAARPMIGEAQPLTAEVARAAPALTAALRALPSTGDDLVTILDAAGAIQHDVLPVLTAAGRLAGPGTQALDRLAPALADLVPVAQYLGPRSRTISAWFANTADLGSHGDAKGDWARFFVMFDPSTASGASAGAPPGNSYTAPGDAEHNAPFRTSDFPHLQPYAPALTGR